MTNPKYCDIAAARERLSGKIHRTPVIRSESVDRRAGCQTFFKCENLQKTGSFKVRGAINAVSQLSQNELKRGVVTHSSGNHAAALAYAASLFGVSAHIVMPSNSSATKISATESYGGKITQCAPTLADRENVAAEIQRQTGAILIPPFDHPNIIAGQGTCAVELLEDVPALDVIVCPIGGGGLMSGTVLAAKSISPAIRVIGAEPAGADDAYRSKQARELILQTNPQTIADGLRTSLGEFTWPFIRDWVDEIVRAEEEEIRAASTWFMQRTKLVIEPSAAVGIAVLFKLIEHDPELKSASAGPLKVGVILCGGNAEF